TAARGAQPARVCSVLFLGEKKGGGGKVGNLLLVFHFSIRLAAGAVEMWESRRFGRDFHRARGKRGKPAFGFPRFPQPRHFHSSLRVGFGLAGSSLRSLFHLAFCLLFLLGLLHSIAR